MDDAALQYYSRHVLLNEWGIEAQAKLAAAHVLVIGAGGLGCPAAHLLAAAGVGRITIADGDVVDATNLQRQYLHTVAAIGQPKVLSIQAALNTINPRCTVTALLERLSGAAILAAVSAADVVLDCTDSFASRHAINRACVAAKKPLISGAAIRFDGQWIAFDASNPHSACYHCLFAEHIANDEHNDDTDRCAVMGVYAPLTHRVGNEQASMAIRLITGIGSVKTSLLTVFNALDGSSHQMIVPRDAGCVVCGDF